MDTKIETYPCVDKSTRLVNFMIDGFIISLIAITIANKMGVRINLNPKNMQEAASLPKEFYSINMCVQFCYYFILEYTTNTTLGKLITKTQVYFINPDSNKFIGCLARSSARLIPFSPIVFLFIGKKTLHDMLSMTVVGKYNTTEHK
jgi:uncharacterized RDD family membrane protein YckC